MMDIYQILKQLPHRFPILLVDRVLEIEKGVRIKALKNVSVKLPLGTLTVVTGVSGSGKSTLIHDTLVLKLKQHFDRTKRDAMPHKAIIGLNNKRKPLKNKVGHSP